MASHLGNVLDFAFSRLSWTVRGPGGGIGGTGGSGRGSDVSHNHQHMVDISHIRDGMERMVHQVYLHQRKQVVDFGSWAATVSWTYVHLSFYLLF